MPGTPSEKPSARGRMARLAGSPGIIRRTVKEEDGRERVETYTLSPIALTPFGAIRQLVSKRIVAEYKAMKEMMIEADATEEHLKMLSDEAVAALRNPMATDWAREAEVVVEVAYQRLHSHHPELSRDDVAKMLEDEAFLMQFLTEGRELDEVDAAAKKASRARPKRAKRAKAARKSGSPSFAASPHATGGRRGKSGK